MVTGREVVPGFAATVNLMVPPPVPLAGEVRLTQAGRLAVSTAQGHVVEEPEPNPTLNCWLPPAASMGVPKVGFTQNPLHTMAALTATVTGMLAGELEADDDVNVSVPLWVPTLSSVGLMLALGTPGVVPEPGEIPIHAPPLSPLAVAV
jgi:hypothetical protein